MGNVRGHGVDPLGVTEASMAPRAAWAMDVFVLLTSLGDMGGYLVEIQPFVTLPAAGAKDRI